MKEEMNSLVTPELTARLGKAGVIAVLVIDEVDDAVPVARALVKGGVTAMELTLRTPAALESLRRIRKEVPEMLAGVGTILTSDQLLQVKREGGELGVAPGCNPKVLETAIAEEFPFIPGTMTASEIESALDMGCRVLKFFPAEPAGGVKYLKSLNSPYSYLGLQYIPLGGLNEENVVTWLEQPFILAIGGSWIAAKSLIRDKSWDQITRNAERAAAVLNKVRN